ncbi:anaerobic glycerol-3-phosphate dehydrogenase subunit GlpA [Actinomyces sp. MRS3W]|uniref:anaerobic glycerol-3-phosphate dehydrogenase subunit GlpA n=1 Tax=Actinomyces sp. MRS3W TaxID=2800796 RepID=UPI0028FD52B4|nr:anaerobic glycerol-3-phosphate dehydrogenase subunit GlpA [Actinomyces sp. MRS3W]MDU0349109.1 anaerobic glycerol-3-phosphate dehydrogenase subunit GlpA [Actinomyces sp. MRS3W]
MRTMTADVVVVGGGATGVGVARDAAMRGMRVVLLERADLAQGTSGRFHGLLHSGGRYVVSDPGSARECAEENGIIARIHADAVELTGGMFVVGPEDDLEFSDRFLVGAREAGVACEELSLSEALRQEPRLNPGIKRAFAVGDGAIDGWQMVWGAARSAREYGATILTYHEVTDLVVEGEGPDRRVVAVRAHGLKTGEDLTVSCAMVVNAAGPWGGKLAAMAGSEAVEIVAGAGIMVAVNHRIVNHVINRCVRPSDGDIIVPDHTVSIIGTTDRRVPDPDHLAIPREEVAQMLDAGEALIPGFRQTRPLHAWVGARPLVRDKRVAGTDTRHMSRGMTVLRHSEAEGLAGLVTVAGGKLTTYRLMAKNTVDAICEELGINRPCTTAAEAVPGSESGRNYRITHRLAAREKDRLENQTICECELVTRKMLTELMDEQPDASFDDLRRQLRIGMGPCQGGFCAARVAGVHVCRGRVDAAGATELLRTFLRHRWIGLWSIIHGEQIRETALDFWMLQGTLDIEDLPTTARPAAAATPIEGAEDGEQLPEELAAALAALDAPPGFDSGATVGAAMEEVRA